MVGNSVKEPAQNNMRNKLLDSFFSVKVNKIAMEISSKYILKNVYKKYLKTIT